MNETRPGIAVKVDINGHSGSSHQPRGAVFLLNESYEAAILSLANHWRKQPGCPEFGLLHRIPVPKGI